MTADKSWPRAPRGQPEIGRRHNGLLRAAGVGNQGAGSAGRGGLNHQLGNRIDRRSHDDKLGFSHAFVQARRTAVDRAHVASRGQAALAPADADDFASQLALTRRHADGAADQSYTDDCDSFVCGHDGLIYFPQRSGRGFLASVVLINLRDAAWIRRRGRRGQRRG
jgi:hypothetical protein